MNKEEGEYKENEEMKIIIVKIIIVEAEKLNYLKKIAFFKIWIYLQYNEFSKHSPL